MNYRLLEANWLEGLGKVISDFDEEAFGQIFDAGLNLLKLSHFRSPCTARPDALI